MGCKKVDDFDPLVKDLKLQEKVQLLKDQLHVMTYKQGIINKSELKSKINQFLKQSDISVQ
jgi:hypothetical protein